MEPQLVLDTSISQRARVRRWEYEGMHARPYPATAHDGFEIAFVERGSLTYRMGREHIEAHAGAMVLVPAGVEHATEFGAGLVGGALHVSDAVVEMLRDADALVPDRAVRVDDVRALAIGRLVVEEARDGDAMCADALLDALARKLCCRSSSARSSSPHTEARDPRVQRAIEFVLAHSRQEIGVEHIARAAGMSRFHMSRAFQQVTGKSPYAYLLDVRLEDAARALTHGASVTDAALSAGFSDLSRFARMFRAKFAVSPREMRAAS